MISATGISPAVAPDDRLARWEVEMLLRGADSIPYGRWSFHQQRMAAVALLEEWNQPPARVLAGAALGIDNSAIREAMSPALDDALVGDLLGHHEQMLVRQAGALLGDIRSSRRGEVIIEALRRICDPDERQTRGISDASARDLIVVLIAECANESDENGAPIEWFALASHALASAELDHSPMPDCVDRLADTRITLEQERRLIGLYSEASRGASGFSQESWAALDAAAVAVDIVGEPLILLGLHELYGADQAKAADYGRRGADRLRLWGTCWDKRLSAINWLGIAQFLERAGTRSERDFQFLVAQFRRIWTAGGGTPAAILAGLDAVELLGRPYAGPPTATYVEHDVAEDFERFSDFDVLPPRFSHYIAHLRENVSQPAMGFYPGLTSRPWWDPLEFAVCTELRKHAPDIIAEFDSLDSASFVPSDSLPALGTAGLVAPLYVRGKKCEPCSERCHVTTAILEASTAIHGVRASAYFRRIPPGFRGPARRGSTNVRLRCHFAIHSSDGAGIAVDGLWENVREGRCIIFDESYLHEEVNPSHREQALLVFDVWHPDLSADEVELLEGLTRYTAAVVDTVLRESA